jgi:hypothetical protein
MPRSRVYLTAVAVCGVIAFAATFLAIRDETPGTPEPTDAPRVIAQPEVVQIEAIPDLRRAAALPRRLPPRARTASAADGGPGAGGTVADTSGTTSDGGSFTGPAAGPPAGGAGDPGTTGSEQQGGQEQDGSSGDVTIGGGSLGGP